MSYTFSFTDDKSQLSAEIFPPVQLSSDGEYELGLINFESYNSMPNVDETCNKFHFDKDKLIVIPTGTYEIKDIYTYITDELKKLQPSSSTSSPPYHLQLTVNNNTLKTYIRANFEIDFTRSNSIGQLLGFGSKILTRSVPYVSDEVVDIYKVNSIRIECNIVTGSYIDGEPSHTIYEFFPDVPAGYKMVETPNPVIYLPVTTRTIDFIALRIVDQSGNLVDFRKERISIRLHLRRRRQ